jgi:DNA-binding NtrC family response regulator
LLKVFQDGCFKQVGGYQNIAHDVRIIATTRLNLPEMVKNGRFRADLFAALSTHTLEVPRLKDRREDISVLCMQILNEYRRTHTTTVKSIDPAVIDEFKSREWPDNVKDLKTLLKRALPLCERNTLRLEHICKVEEMNIGIINEPIWSIQKIDEAHLDFQKKYIIFKLKQANGDKALAAAKIGRSTRQLNRWIKELHITPGLYKSSDPE